MKQYLLNICILFVCISGTLLLPQRSYGQLNGNYTINPTKSASNTNYQNWASAIGDLLSASRTDGGTAQGSGVSGPVVFSVYDTLYDNVSISINAITGSSFTNKITFKSAKGDSSKCRLRYASGTAATDDYVIMLNNADYITFRQIGFERTGTNTYGTVIQITGDADNVSFIRCLMKGQKGPSSITKGFQTGIGSCVFFSGNGDSAQLIQNRLLYGYNGIYNLQTCTANNYSQNLIDTPGSAGIYVNSQTSFKVIGNTFNMGDFGAGKGHYTCYALRCDASSGFIIANNKAVVTAVNSQVCRSFVFSSNTSTAAAPAMVYNNSIYNSGGTGNCNGMAINSCAYLNIFYNNILINNSLSDGAALFQYITTTNSKINLVNNNFVNKGGGYAVSAGDANASGFDSVDYNNLYASGTYLTLWNSSSGKSSSLSAFQSVSGKCANCMNVDPGFVSSGDLHVSNIAINGKALPYPKIQTDIDNEARNSTKPDIGSDEFFPVTTDAGISAIDSPSMFCAGKQIVKVKFQNYGIDTLKSLQIGWSVNGTAQTGVSWTGKVAAGASSASISLGNYTFSGNTAYNFKVWTYNPNTIPDGKPLNDTLKQTKFAAMAGTYTIGDTSIANYKTFNNAVTAMGERGICGAVTFNVFNGLYKEQLGLTQLPGMGASAPITFQSISKDSSKVVLSLIAAANSGSNNALIQLRGANYVTFKGITFERTGTNLYAQVVHIMNGSHHNTFTNCQMTGLQLGAANTSANTIWSDQSQDNFNTFRNNYIKWGNVGMAYAGNSQALHETGTIIENNTFDGAFNNSLQLSFNDKVIVRGNKFLNVTAALAGNADVLLNMCDSSISINGNYFSSNNTSNSILVNACNASSSKPAFISNNSIVKGSGSGISFDSTTNTSVVFNSINFTGTTSTNAGIITNGNSTGITMKNNNIVMSGGEVFHIISASEISSSNNNNLYVKGPEFAYWGGVAYTSFNGLITASAKDALSISTDPFFTSSSNLHIKNPLLKGTGTPVSGITTDMDGETRNALTPDIGADEFKLVANDAGIVRLTKPATNNCSGILNVEAVIKNIGGDTLKRATITWSVNGIAQTPYNWTGKMATNRMDTVVIGTYNFTSTLSPKFIIKSNFPNGFADGISFNDSILANRTLTGLPNFSAGKDDTICLGDQLLIGPISNTNYRYYWTDIFGTLIDSVSQIYVKPPAKASFVLEAITKAFGCSKKDTVIISTTPKPLADAGPDKNLCYGDKFQIGKAAQTGFSYSWTSSPAGFSSTSANPTVSPLVTTTYTLEKTINATGCKASDFAVITVILPPASQITGTSAACDGDRMVYNAKTTTGNSYLWAASGGQIVGGQNTSTVNIKWNTAGSGQLKLIETNSNLCKDTVNYNVTVSPVPVADFSIVNFCKGSTTLFTDLSTGAQNYAWTFGDGGISSQKNPSHVYAAVATFSVRLIASNSFACTDTISKQVVINPLPVANFGITKTAEKTFDFSDSSTVGSGSITKWRWSFGDGDTAIIKNPSHVYAAGNFDIKLCVTSLAGCETCVTKNFNVVGINNKLLNKQMSIAPNPGTGLFKLTATEAMQSVTVTDVMGQTIGTYYPTGNTLSIDLTQQGSGIYFINVNTMNGSGILKVVKQ